MDTFSLAAGCMSNKKERKKYSLVRSLANIQVTRWRLPLPKALSLPCLPVRRSVYVQHWKMLNRHEKKGIFKPCWKRFSSHCKHYDDTFPGKIFRNRQVRRCVYVQKNAKTFKATQKKSIFKSCWKRFLPHCQHFDDMFPGKNFRNRYPNSEIPADIPVNQPDSEQQLFPNHPRNLH